MKTKTLSADRAPVGPRKTTRALSSDAIARRYLFVYGTLKQGGKSHRELAKDPGVQFVGDARIRGDLYQPRGADFPGAVPTSVPNRFVYGQLFFMQNPRKTLAALDAFEDVDQGLFRRELVDVWVRGKRTKAWMYFYSRSVNPSDLLATGVYS